MAMRSSYGAGVQPHVLSSRIDPTLHAELVDEANEVGLTVNAMLNQILRERYRDKPPASKRRDKHQDAIDKLGGDRT